MPGSENLEATEALFFCEQGAPPGDFRISDVSSPGRATR